MTRYGYRILRVRRLWPDGWEESYGGTYGSEERAHWVCRWYDRFAWFHCYEMVMVEEVEL